MCVSHGEGPRGTPISFCLVDALPLCTFYASKISNNSDLSGIEHGSELSSMLSQQLHHYLKYIINNYLIIANNSIMTRQEGNKYTMHHVTIGNYW